MDTSKDFEELKKNLRNLIDKLPEEMLDASVYGAEELSILEFFDIDSDKEIMPMVGGTERSLARFINDTNTSVREYFLKRKQKWDSAKERIISILDKEKIQPLSESDIIQMEFLSIVISDIGFSIEMYKQKKEIIEVLSISHITA